MNFLLFITIYYFKRIFKVGRTIEIQFYTRRILLIKNH